MPGIASNRVTVPADATGIIVAGNPAVQVRPVSTNTGTVDLTTLTFGGGGTVDGLTVVAGGITCTFVAPASAAAVASQLNAALGAGSASLDGGNHLVLAAGLAGGTALTALGLTVPSPTRVYQGGATFQNTDTVNGAWIGPAGTNGASVATTTPGYYLAPNGGQVTYPPVDISELYVFASAGGPKINWHGVDLA